MRTYLFILSFFATVITCGQNPTANGYKGIWFTLGQFSEYGDKYSGGLGTYTADHIPIAIYSAKAKKTFFTYGGTTKAGERHLLIMISYFDHVTKTVPRPVVVYDKAGVDDPHDNAALSIDKAGYIWVFVSGRSTARPGIIFKSDKPYDITSFSKIKEGEMTYPQPWWVKGEGFMYMFTKYTRGRELYWSTSPDGKSWAPDQKLAGLGGHYQVTNMYGKKLVSVFNYHPGGNVDKRTNLYAVQTDDLGKTWKTIDGKVLNLPLSDVHNAALIRDYEAENKLVYINDLNFDKEGNPVILAVISNDFRPGPKGDPREWTIIKWKNGQWSFSKVCTSTHNYDMGSLYTGGKTWTIIGPTEAGSQHYGSGGEIAVWTSKDEGATWTKIKFLTRNSGRNHDYVRRPLNANPEFFAFWADGNADRLSESHLYFAEENGSVFQLPYEMTKENEKPETYFTRSSGVSSDSEFPHQTPSDIHEADAISSNTISVKINGRNVFTQKYKTCNYVHFSTASAFHVTVDYIEPINEISVYPSHSGIIASKSKNSSTFLIPEPGYYVVKINQNEKLFIFADEYDSGPGKDTVNVMSFIPEEELSNSITTYIQNALNKTAGSGKVLYFPSGIYRTGSLAIKSNTKVYLDKGAILKGTGDLSSFGFGDGIKPNSFLRIKDARNVSIKGRGIIDGNGRFLRDRYTDNARMRLLLILNSKNITIDGIIVRDPGSWNTHILYSDSVSIRNVKMLNDVDLANTDGFDPDASRDVLIENCFAYCSDDNVAVKTTGSSGYLRDLENITVRGCLFLTKKSSLKVGTETNASSMKHIVFENNDVIECDRGMALYCSDGALFQDIKYVNNRFNDNYPDSKQSFMNFTITKRNKDSRAGEIKEVLISNCTFDKAFPRKSEISGFDKDHTISIEIENLSMAGQKVSVPETVIKKNDFAIINIR